MALLDPVKQHPVRLQRSQYAREETDDALFVGPGTKWANPFQRPDVEALRGVPDVEAAFQRGGWRAAAVLLYREHLREQGLNPSELRGKNLICTCKLTDPCHADLLIKLANVT